MRWRARVGEDSHEVVLDRGADGAVEASVDGRRYRLSVTEAQPMVYSLLVEGASHEAMIRVSRGVYRVRLGPAVFEVIPEEAERADLKAAGGRGGLTTIAAVMPGRVLRVLVEPGQAVEARQGLVVLEAMKMENELSAPRAATVRYVKVAPGATVETGDPLVELE